MAPIHRRATLASYLSSNPRRLRRFITHRKFSMKLTLKPLNSLVLAGLLATVGASAMAQDAAGPLAAPATAGNAGKHHGAQGDHHQMRQRDPAKMQAMMTQHMADLKARLKITPAQEGAWTSFTAAMQPPADMMMGQRPTPEQRAEMDKLTTPERIDKMRAMRAQHMAAMTAAMDKRGDATKAFYAALTPAQQKIFDAEHQKMGSHEGRHQAADGMRPKN